MPVGPMLKNKLYEKSENNSVYFAHKKIYVRITAAAVSQSLKVNK